MHFQSGHLYCALCGTEVVIVRDEVDEGTRYIQRSCQCGRSAMLHIDAGKLDLGNVELDDNAADYEIFA